MTNNKIIKRLEDIANYQFMKRSVPEVYKAIKEMKKYLARLEHEYCNEKIKIGE